MVAHEAWNYFSLGDPLAATQPTDEFFTKVDFAGPKGFFPPGNPSIEVGGFASHLNGRVPRKKEAFMTFNIGLLRTIVSIGWVAAKGPPISQDYLYLCRWSGRLAGEPPLFERTENL